MGKIEKVDRESHQRRVKYGELSHFKYTPNQRGFIFLQVCAALLFLIAFLVYSMTQFEPRYWVLLSGGLVIFGGFLISLVLRWSHFAKHSGLSFDEDYLYVTTARRVMQVPWSALDAHSSGFANVNPKDQGTLKIRIGEDQVAVRLFNAFVWIDDFPSFLAELLSQLKKNSDESVGVKLDSGAAENEAIEVEVEAEAEGDALEEEDEVAAEDSLDAATEGDRA